MILKNQPRTALAVAVTLILLGAAPAVRADLSFTAAQQPARRSCLHFRRRLG